MIRRILCQKGLHAWSKPAVVQFPDFRLVGRVCRRDGCDAHRSHRSEVWSEPVRVAVTTWADEVREHARVNGGAG